MLLLWVQCFNYVMNYYIVTNMEFMFAGCYKLEYLNILNFNLKNICNNNNMFIELNKNCNIIQKFK